LIKKNLLFHEVFSDEISPADLVIGVLEDWS
jgi:hypothetical protein